MGDALLIQQVVCMEEVVEVIWATNFQQAGGRVLVQILDAKVLVVVDYDFLSIDSLVL